VSNLWHWLARNFGQTEIEDLRLSAFGNKKVCWFQIAVNNSRAVRHVEGVGNLRSEIHQLLDRHRLSLDTRLQRAAFEVLHHNVVAVVILSDVVDRADVGMVERRRCAGLTPETL
jgi:ribosomal protein S16